MHLPKCLVEIHRAKPLRDEIGAQRSTKSGRAAEPDAGPCPAGQHLAQALAAQASLFGFERHMQPGVRCLGFGFQQRQAPRLGGQDALDEVDRCLIGRDGALLHAGNERCDADVARHRNLLGLLIVKVEASVGHLYGDRLACPDAVGQGGCSGQGQDCVDFNKLAFFSLQSAGMMHFKCRGSVPDQCGLWAEGPPQL